MNTENKQALSIPKDFAENTITNHGAKGQEWLARLPAIIQSVEKEHKLSKLVPIPHHGPHYILRAKQKDGRSIVLKCCLPGEECNNEIAALHQMQGDAMVRLIAADRTQGYLLLEGCNPGESLADLSNDSEATSIAASIIKKLYRPISENTGFPTTRDWFQRLDKTISLPKDFASQHITRAKEIADRLHQQSQQDVLLHGDLHHYNILSAERQPWLVIDPKGVIGPAEYECGAFLRNPIPQIAGFANLKKILDRRASIFAEVLGFDKRTILDWAYAQAVLACVWCLDMGSEGWQVLYSCVEVLGILCA